MDKKRKYGIWKIVESATNMQGVNMQGVNMQGASCPAINNSPCADQRCVECPHLPLGLWLCEPCIDLLLGLLPPEILPYYGDAPCEMCGDKPLLTLRIGLKD